MCPLIPQKEDPIYKIRREQMVYEQIEKRGVSDTLVLEAMRKVQRHLFVPAHLIEDAYKDGPLSIGEGQTISQPYVVGSMTAHLNLTSKSKVLEIGTGSGYQTAVLAEIAESVCSVERVSSLLEVASQIFNKLGYNKIMTRLRDGALGWPEEAPFDAIIVTAAAKALPDALVSQLDAGGVIVIPIDRGLLNQQELVKVTKTDNGIKSRVLYPVRFVPLLKDTVK